MPRKLSAGEKALKELNAAVKMSGCAFVAAAKGIGVDPNTVYRWRNTGAVADGYVGKVTVWAHKTAAHHMPMPKTPKVTSTPWAKPKPWDGTWIHTTPKKIKAFLERHQMRKGTFAVKIHVSPGTVSNWLDGSTVAIPKNQRMAAKIMEGLDEEKRFIDGSFAGKRDPINPAALEKKPSKKLSKRDRLAETLMSFAKEDGDSLADAVLYTADILRSLQTVGKLPE